MLSFLYSPTLTSIHGYWKWFLLPFPKASQWKESSDFLLGIFILLNDFVQFSEFWKYCSVQNSSCFKYICAISILSDGKLAQSLNISFQKVHLKNTFYRSHLLIISLVQFSSVTQSCPTLCDPMNCSTPGLHVHHQLLEFTQTHVHQVDDAVQTSYPLLFPSLVTFSLSQHQGLFQQVSSSHKVAKVL